MSNKVDPVDSMILNNFSIDYKVDENTYSVWAADMSLLLSCFGLESYILEEKLKKITANDSNYDESCIRIGSSQYFYSKEVTKLQIKNDNKAKLFITKNLTNDIKLKLDVKTQTAKEIWDLLEMTYKKSKEERRLILKRKLENTTYNRTSDFSMFLSELKNNFNRLKDLGFEESDEQKFNYLYSALPADLINETNIINFQDDWEECCNHLLKTIPRLKFIKTIKSKNINKNYALATVKCSLWSRLQLRKKKKKKKKKKKQHYQ